MFAQSVNYAVLGPRLIGRFRGRGLVLLCSVCTSLGGRRNGSRNLCRLKGVHIRKGTSSWSCQEIIRYRSCHGSKANKRADFHGIINGPVFRGTRRRRIYSACAVRFQGIKMASHDAFWRILLCMILGSFSRLH